MKRILIFLLIAFLIVIISKMGINSVNADELHKKVLKERFGIEFVSSDKEVVLTKEEAIEKAHKEFGSLHEISKEMKLKAKAEHVIYKNETVKPRDIWLVIFEGGKYPGRGKYPDAMYLVAVFVDSQTGECFGATAFDPRNYSSKK